MTYRTIYLIRHGQYNPEIKEGPQAGKLSETGRLQAIKTADFMAEIPLTAIYASTLDRAIETAGVIAAKHNGLAVQQSPLLQEITPPLPYLALKHVKDLSLEEITQDRLRVEEAYSTFIKAAGERDDYEAIVCHGNVIRYLVCRALQISPLIWMNFEIYNCSVTTIEIDALGNAILLGYNESGHLPQGLKTQNLSPMGLGLKYAQPEKKPEAQENTPQHPDPHADAEK